MIPPTPRSIAQLPPNAKLAIRLYVKASDAKLRRLGKRRLTSDGRIQYPPALTEQVDILHRAWRELGMANGAWYQLVRTACLKASREHPAGLMPNTTKRYTAMFPWLQAADVELQSVCLLAVLDRFEIAVPDRTRQVFMAPWFAARLDR